MTTPTSISNGLVGLEAAIPPGAPDEATLNRLAAELFSAATAGREPHIGPAPRSTQDLLTVASRVPSLAPAAVAPNGVPDSAVEAFPALGHFGGNVLSVPEAYAITSPEQAAPRVADVAPSASPYYFLNGGKQGPAAASLVVPPLDNGNLVAQSFALPGDADLRALLSGPAPAAVIANPAARQGTGSFYFVDTAQPLSVDSQVPALAVSGHPLFDVQAIRRDFPILQERVNGRPLVWLDNAATTHKPQTVIDRIAYFYAHENSNIHRAAHELAARATDAYEAARDKVARFLGASSTEEIVFVRGATEAINLVAKTWGWQNVGEGDEIVVSNLEHHANIVPWQQLATEKGARLRVIPVDDDGQILLDEYQRLLSDRTKLVAVTQVSNALGTITPIKEIIDLAHRAGAKVLVDGAQAVSHLRVNVQALDADFYVFSGHKIFGPTGIGVVYGKRQILETMPPWQGGGNMIEDVTFECTRYQPAPARFEAGTGNIADAVGLGAALDYVERVGLENIARYEHDLVAYATQGLRPIPGLRLIGTAKDKASVVSFVLEGYRTEQVGEALNREGIAVRSGHHCAQPILRRLGVEATVRPSLAFYNTCEEVDLLVSVVNRLARARR